MVVVNALVGAGFCLIGAVVLARVAMRILGIRGGVTLGIAGGLFLFIWWLGNLAY
jgi:hypothetical protein